MKTLAILLAFAASRAAAQSTAVAGVRELWQTSRDYLVAAAEQVPEAEYAFKPTPEVRSLGELFAHVASSQRMLCATALGEKEGGDTVGTTKADVVGALKASNDYCARAYAMTDTEATRRATPSGSVARSVLGPSRTRFYVLAMNAWHDNEHYGNVVTYMRLRHLVPPSSRSPNVPTGGRPAPPQPRPGRG